MSIKLQRYLFFVVAFFLSAGCAGAQKQEKTPLISAVKGRDLPTVESLIASGADVNARGSSFDWGKTAIIEAAIRGDDEISKRLLRAGANVNGVDNYGDTALMAAAEFGHADLAQLLIEYGADVNATKSNLTTALMIASRKGELEVVKVLLDADADVNIGLGSGDTALSLAALRGNILIMEALIGKGASVNQNDEKGRSLLFRCIGKAGPATKLLITSGADVNERFVNGMTPLMATAYQGDADSLRTLLAHGANVDMRCKSTDERVENSTALHWAAVKGHVDIIVILLEAHSDIEAKDRKGHTALILAAMEGHTKAVEVLLKAGATSDCKDNNGFTPLMYATKKGYRVVEKALKEAGAVE